MKFHRDRETFEAWWEGAANRDEIADSIEGLRGQRDAEFGLHHLMLEVFQSDTGVMSWMRVSGLARRFTPSYLVLDMDISYDGNGERAGLEVVASMHADSDADTQWLKASTYVDLPWHLFASDLPPEPREALAGILDQAVDLINADIADRDRFIFTARDILT